MTGLFLAISFLTRLPVHVPPMVPGDWGRAARWFAVPGALVATIGVLALTAGSLLFTPLVGATLAVGAMVWATGALHVDGLSDCLDGWAVNGDAERRLTVMHDSRVGAVGAAGTALWLVLKVALLTACVDAGTAAPAIWTACIGARAFLPFEMAYAKPATPGIGVFARLSAEVKPTHAAAGALVAITLLAPAFVVFPGSRWQACFGLMGAACATAAWHAAWRVRIGGVNGDVLGAAVEIREVILLAAVGATWPG